MTDRQASTLATRIVVATILVALVAVGVAAAVSVPLISGSAEAQARETLRHDADLLVGATGGPAGLPRRPLARRVVSARGVEVVVVTQRGAGPGADAVDVAALRAGRDVSDVRDRASVRTLVEGRADGAGGGVVLYQPVASAPDIGVQTRRRLVLSLFVCLAAASAATRMATGDRDVRVDERGPREVAEVAQALNGLAVALATSEAREREFLLSVSHELRTPLTAVQGYAEALADGTVGGDDVAGAGRTVLAEARRLDRLIGDLLDLARLGAADFRLDLTVVDVGDLVERASVVWRHRAARHGVEVRVEASGAAVLAWADATRLRQIVDGLLENALRVTPSGAPIVLAARTDDLAALVEIRDGGPGLTSDDLAVAFEPGVLHARYRGVRQVGTGVGLALASRLATRMGGSISAAAAPEGGAAFTVRLPLGSPA
jgi:two-component system sensor histidine kinase BaeS